MAVTVAIGASLVLGIGGFSAIRHQWLVADREFLNSMIPHHSAAILMRGRATITDTEVQKLCRSIIQSQQKARSTRWRRCWIAALRDLVCAIQDHRGTWQR
ncbi:MAG: DUF305 domain-containing protein [Pseudomonadota bacterium]